MDTKILEDIVSKLLQKGKGILAADESNNTCTKRLSEYCDCEIDEEVRREYREMLLETPLLEKFVSGVILHDETFWQRNSENISFITSLTQREILPGIKVDLGTKPMPQNEKELITTGIDDLEKRIEEYVKNGAKFTKWRAVFTIDSNLELPSDLAIEENTLLLAQYAKIVQKHNMVPIVEPEVLLLGDHGIETSFEVTKKVLKSLFENIKKYEIYLPGLILKTSMVIEGNKHAVESSSEKIAQYTVSLLKEAVPENIGGVVFLSGGQTPVEATSNFNEIVKIGNLPYEIAFSYARALQDPALRIWSCEKRNIEKAREAFRDRLDMNHLADSGEYKVEFEWLD